MNAPLKAVIVKRLFLQVGLFLALSGIFGFLSSNRTRINSDLAIEAVKPLPKVSVQEMQAFIGEAKIVAIDARSEGEYQKGHIRGAISLPAGDLDSALAHHLELFSIDKPIVVYCSGVGCDLSELVARKLAALGMDQISVFSPGWSAWKNAGLPTEP